jgi:hypothetical protein
MENTKTPFELGYEACQQFNYWGTNDENPYWNNTDEFKEWEKGWQWYITQTIEWERDEAMDISDQDYHERQQYCND